LGFRDKIKRDLRGNLRESSKGLEETQKRTKTDSKRNFRDGNQRVEIPKGVWGRFKRRSKKSLKEI
jgi:hypothetical protein